MTFNDFQDACDYFRLALGEFEHDYDIEGMASDATDWVDGKLTLTKEGSDFWACVESHQL